MKVPDTYRAYQYERYGENELKLNPAVQTSSLLPNEVRIKVVSAAINPADNKMLSGLFAPMLGDPSAENPFGIGSDASGIVVEVGSDTKRLKVGDQVYTTVPFKSHDAMADYLVVQEDVVAIKPRDVTFNQAASLSGVGLASYQALFEHAKLEKGETLLILGGSCATGMMALQLAHSIGARVVATTSAKNAAFVKSLGADQTIDYHVEKWTDVLDQHSVDVVYNCGVEPDAWNHAQQALKKDTGRFMTLSPLKDPVESDFGVKNVGFFSTRPSAENLAAIAKFVERGELVPVIDSVYPFEEFPQALAKLKGGHARGKLVVQVNAAP